MQTGGYLRRVVPKRSQSALILIGQKLTPNNDSGLSNTDKTCRIDQRSAHISKCNGQVEFLSFLMPLLVWIKYQLVILIKQRHEETIVIYNLIKAYNRYTFYIKMNLLSNI